MVLRIYQFWVGFGPIFKVRFFPLYFNKIEIKKRDAFSRQVRDLPKKEKWAEQSLSTVSSSFVAVCMEEAVFLSRRSAPPCLQALFSCLVDAASFAERKRFLPFQEDSPSEILATEVSFRSKKLFSQWPLSSKLFVGPIGIRPYYGFFPSPSYSSSSRCKRIFNKQPHLCEFSIVTHISYITGKRTASGFIW